MIKLVAIEINNTWIKAVEILSLFYSFLMGGYLGGKMKMEIYVKPFDKKFAVKATNKVVRSAMKVQLNFAKMNNVKGKTAVEVYEEQLNSLEEVISFLSHTLNLNKKQREELDNLDFDETISTAGYICDRLMGMTDEQIEEEAKKVKEDPKK